MTPPPDIQAPSRPNEAPRLVIVDAHGHAFRAYHALAPMHAPDGQPTHALFGLAGLLRRLVFEERPDRVAVVFDAPDDTRRTFRSALYPAYKAHRPARPEALATQLPLCRELTRAFGLPALEHPDFEADDLVATLVAEAEARGFETTILSADKDLMQLVSPRTTLWDAMRGKRYTPPAVHEKLGVPPAQVADYLALVGDASDNVPGVAGVGPKGASTLLAAHGSLAGIYANLAVVPPRERARLEASRDLAFLSLELTRLRADVPLGLGLDDLTLAALDPGPLLALAERLGFRGLANEARARPTPPRPERPTPPRPAAPQPTRPTPPSPPELIELTDLGGPRGLAALRAELGLPTPPTLQLVGDRLALTFSRRRYELPLRAPGPLQGGLFARPTTLSGAEVARLLRDTLGERAAALTLDQGGAQVAALACLERWGAR